MDSVSLAEFSRSTQSSFSLDICPRCEEGVLTIVEVPHDITVAGSVLRLPRVQAEQCRVCGYRALSGREVRLFDVLFAPQYHQVGDLIAALRAARYHGMFLREDRGETAIGFGARDYVDALAFDLRDLYLDNESGHVLEGLDIPAGPVAVDVAGRTFLLKLPKIGEGENGVVFDHAADPDTVFKIAKPRQYSREHIRAECENTAFFAGHGVPVPAITEFDPYGSYAVKQRIAGVSLAVLYEELGAPDTRRHRRARAAMQAFADRLLDLFVRHPEAKTSISPNNIFIVEDGQECRCLLVDTGPAPCHDYSTFDFSQYWEVTLPQKIRQYRAVGYI